MKAIKQKAKNTKAYYLNLPASLRTNLDQLATLTGKPVSEVIRQSVQESYLTHLQTE